MNVFKPSPYLNSYLEIYLLLSTEKKSGSLEGSSFSQNRDLLVKMEKWISCEWNKADMEEIVSCTAEESMCVCIYDS